MTKHLSLTATAAVSAAITAGLFTGTGAPSASAAPACAAPIVCPLIGVGATVVDIGAGASTAFTGLVGAASGGALFGLIGPGGFLIGDGLDGGPGQDGGLVACCSAMEVEAATVSPGNPVETAAAVGSSSATAEPADRAARAHQVATAATPD